MFPAQYAMNKVAETKDFLVRPAMFADMRGQVMKLPIAWKETKMKTPHLILVGAGRGQADVEEDGDGDERECDAERESKFRVVAHRRCRREDGDETNRAGGEGVKNGLQVGESEGDKDETLECADRSVGDRRSEIEENRVPVLGIPKALANLFPSPRVLLAASSCIGNYPSVRHELVAFGQPPNLLRCADKQEQDNPHTEGGAPEEKIDDAPGRQAAVFLSVESDEVDAYTEYDGEKCISRISRRRLSGLTHSVVETLAERLFISKIPGGCEESKTGSNDRFEPAQDGANHGQLGIIVASRQTHHHMITQIERERPRGRRCMREAMGNCAAA